VVHANVSIINNPPKKLLESINSLPLHNSHALAMVTCAKNQEHASITECDYYYSVTKPSAAQTKQTLIIVINNKMYI